MSTLTTSAGALPANGHLPLEVGSEVVSAGRTITESDLVSFAALTGDWHPQHADAEWSRRGRFGERVAHGMLVLSYSVGLVDFDPERVVALRGLDSVAFKRPVRIGDTIRVATRVEEARPLDDDHLRLSLAWRILNQDEQVVARAKLQVICRAEPDGDAVVERPGAETLTTQTPPTPAPPDGDDLGDLYGGRLAL